MNWPADVIDCLRECWARGLSASQCARAINEKFGTQLSRSAIIGKVHRLGLARRRRGTRSRAGTNIAVLENEPLPPHAVTPAELLPHHCRWPFGDPRLPGFRLCGARRVVPLPYCATHARIAYQIIPMQKERAA